MEPTKTDLESVAELLGTDVTDDASAITLLSAAVADLRSENVQLVELAESHETRAKSAEAKVVELSNVKKDEADAPDDRDVKLYDTMIELSQSRGDMPKFVADKLRKAVKDRPVLLSRTGGESPAIDFVIELFKDAKLGVKSEPTTGKQVLLSRVTPDGEPSSDDLPFKKMAERYNASAPK